MFADKLSKSKLLLLRKKVLRTRSKNSRGKFNQSQLPVLVEGLKKNFKTAYIVCVKFYVSYFFTIPRLFCPKNKNENL